MFTYVLAGIVCLYLTLPSGEAVKCYHCYDSFNKTLAMGSIDGDDHYDHRFVRCDKNKNKWNTWDCPSHWPLCVLLSATVDDHSEVVRTCAEKNFCANYNPPPNVKLKSCRECNTTLCNDYETLPDPPVGPGPLFVFNININLNVKKSPIDTTPDGQ